MQLSLLPTSFEYATALQIAWHHARNEITESDWVEAKTMVAKWNSDRRAKQLEEWI